MAQSPRGLGRGLESLIPASARPQAAPAGGLQTVPIRHIRANPDQPRQRFDEAALKELADSIASQGLIQPLVVAPVDPANARNGEKFEIIAGERRWRAAQIAGLESVPIVVKTVTQKEKLQLALIENIQREDLNPMEEAAAFKKLMEAFELTQEELAKAMSKSRVVIANTLRLLNLPQNIQDAVAAGEISAGHARSIASISDEDKQKEVAGKVLSEGLTVRDVEKVVADWKGMVAGGKIAREPRKDPEIRNLEETLQQILGTKVDIKAAGQGRSVKGHVKISFYSLEDFERLVEIFKRK